MKKIAADRNYDTFRKTGKTIGWKNVLDDIEEDAIESLVARARAELSILMMDLSGPGPGCGIPNGGLLPEDSCQQILDQGYVVEAYLRKIEQIARLV